jgi:hypothetical protein
MPGMTDTVANNSQAFSALQRELRTPLSASRIRLDYRAPLKDGSPIPERDAFITNTGIATIDEASRKAASMEKFSEHAARNVFTSTKNGGLYGLLCGLAIVLVSQKNAILDFCRLPYALFEEKGNLRAVVEKHVPWYFVAAGLLIGGAGALMGSILGFLEAGRGSAEDFHKLMNMQKPLPKKGNAHQDDGRDLPM